MLYVKTPLHGNEFKVCDELTDEVVAIFFNQQDAVDYVNDIFNVDDEIKKVNIVKINKK